MDDKGLRKGLPSQTLTFENWFWFQPQEGLLLPELPRHGANGELVDPLPPAVTEEQLAALAEAAYAAAGAPLPLGELQLDLGCLALARQLDPKPHLQKASEAFQVGVRKVDETYF